MRRSYNHITHSYEYAPASHKIIEHLANTRGAHNDKIGNAHSSGLFVWILIAGVAFAVVCKGPVVFAEAKDDCLVHIAGLCI